MGTERTGLSPNANSEARELNTYINLNDEQIKIVKLLGQECEKYYV